MRIAYLVPLVAVFGCAHQSSESKEPAATASVTTPAEPQKEQAAAPEVAKEPAPAVAAATPKVCPTIRVHFAFDSAVIDEAQKPVLDQAVSCLGDNPHMRISVAGNTDERGSQEYNLGLGMRRAVAVSQYLESKGATPDQVQAVVSYGEDNPICDEKDEACWQKNRRTAVRATCRM
jgi:peptidoglycan-associated lipoprotein